MAQDKQNNKHHDAGNKVILEAFQDLAEAEIFARENNEHDCDCGFSNNGADGGANTGKLRNEDEVCDEVQPCPNPKCNGVLNALTAWQETLDAEAVTHRNNEDNWRANWHESLDFFVARTIEPLRESGANRNEA